MFLVLELIRILTFQHQEASLPCYLLDCVRDCQRYLNGSTFGSSLSSYYDSNRRYSLLSISPHSASSKMSDQSNKRTFEIVEEIFQDEGKKARTSLQATKTSLWLHSNNHNSSNNHISNNSQLHQTCKAVIMGIMGMFLVSSTMTKKKVR